jgi:hypothetical protein
MELNILVTFLGWCSVINLVILSFSSVLLIGFGNNITRLQSRLIGIDENKLLPLYLNYLGNYKIMILIFNLVPYFALLILSY